MDGLYLKSVIIDGATYKEGDAISLPQETATKDADNLEEIIVDQINLANGFVDLSGHSSGKPPKLYRLDLNKR